MMPGSHVIVNEVLSYIQFRYKNETQKDLIRILDDFHGAEAISEAKTVLWQIYGVAGHDALPKSEDRRQTRNGLKSLKEKELDDILNGMKAIDEIYCDNSELPTTFAAINLVNLPSCKADDADIRHRVKCLELQMKEVLNKRLNYATVACPPPPASLPRPTQSSNLPGTPIPVIQANYYPPGSLLEKPAANNDVTVSSTARTNCNASSSNTSDQETTAESPVIIDHITPSTGSSTGLTSSKEDDKKWSVYTRNKDKRRRASNAVYGNRKEENMKRGLQRHELFVFQISKDVSEDQIKDYIKKHGQANAVSIVNIKKMTRKDSPSD